MRASGVILVGLIAFAARAGDAPAPGDDSIAAAKKDLATIKSAGGAQDPSATLPSLQVREIGQVPDVSAGQLPPLTQQEKEDALDPAKKKRGTGNWLVDAMDKKADSPKDAKGRDREDLLKADQDLLKGDEREGQVAEVAREKAGPKEAAASVYNPLDSFMAGWISAKDHDLLLPAGRGEGLPGGDAARGRSEMLPGLDLGASSAAVENLISPPEGAGLSDFTKGAPNPYLALLDQAPAPPMRALSLPEGLGLTVPGESDAQRAPSPGLDRPSADGSRTFIPDFAQPPDDDKYFKQMKKF